jgi:hypothetical protein
VPFNIAGDRLLATLPPWLGLRYKRSNTDSVPPLDAFVVAVRLLEFDFVVLGVNVHDLASKLASMDFIRFAWSFFCCIDCNSAANREQRPFCVSAIRRNAKIQILPPPLQIRTRSYKLSRFRGVLCLDRACDVPGEAMSEAVRPGLPTTQAALVVVGTPM